MSETQHTPGPWRAGSQHPVLGDVQVTGIFTDEEFGDLIASCDTSPCNPQAEANARRIVACVNACDELPTDMLEQVGKLVTGSMLRYADLRQQRDELLAGLEMVMPALEAMRKQWPRSEHDDSIDVVDFARTVLAKAKGEA
jgi:hypothetical protein